MTKSEMITRIEEAHFHNNIALDRLVLAAQKEDAYGITSALYNLDSDRFGMPNSIGEDYESGYFSAVADEYISENGIEDVVSVIVD